MLTDPKAIEIIANAKQKNVRNPKRSRKHFENIYSDFFKNLKFDGDYLDMGPGQYDFGVMAKERGANQCYAIEYDPAVIELGEYLGFKVIEGNIKNFSREMSKDRTFTGVFNKFSYNCFWYIGADEKHQKFVDEVASSISENGWAWIAPWNGVPKSKDLSENEIIQLLDRQKELFISKGFKVIEIAQSDAKKYGINGTIANNIIFTYGI